MRQIYYVDWAMCGGEELPGEFDLEEFCEVLQGKLQGVEVVAVSDPNESAFNLDPSLVPDTVFTEALGQVLPSLNPAPTQDPLMNCLKCISPMIQVTFAGIEVDRCTDCQGLFFKDLSARARK